MIRLGAVVLALMTAAVLQTAVFPHLSIAGFRPDLLLLVAVAFGLREGPTEGLRVGFAAGLLADLLTTQTPIGLQALVFLAVGYGVGLARPYFATESISAPLLIALVSGFLGVGGFGLLSRLLGDPSFTAERVLQAAVFVALYNTILAPVVFGLIGRLGRRFPAERTAPL